MADHSQTVSNTLGPVGGGPASIWGSEVWGSFKWGSGSLTVEITKLITNSQGGTTTINSQYVKNLDAETLSPSDAYSKEAQISISESMASLTGDATEQYLQPGGSDWNYVYPSGASNLEDQDTVTWTSGSAGSASWTTVTASSVTWSAL